MRFVLALCLIAVASPVLAQTTYLRDPNGNVKEKYVRQGDRTYIEDINGNRKGYFENGGIYDKNGNLKGRLSPQR